MHSGRKQMARRAQQLLAISLDWKGWAMLGYAGLCWAVGSLSLRCGWVHLRGLHTGCRMVQFCNFASKELRLRLHFLPGTEECCTRYHAEASYPKPGILLVHYPTMPYHTICWPKRLLRLVLLELIWLRRQAFGDAGASDSCDNRHLTWLSRCNCSCQSLSRAMHYSQ